LIASAILNLVNLIASVLINVQIASVGSAFRRISARGEGHMTFKSYSASAAFAVGVLGATAASSKTIDFTTLQFKDRSTALTPKIPSANAGFRTRSWLQQAALA